MTRSPPVIFLNPNVLAPVMHVGLVREPAAAVGLVSGTSITDEPANALASFAERVGGVIVGTASPITGTDARDMLLSRGVRVLWGPDWFSHADLADRYAGAAAWLARHGPRPAVLIDHAPLRDQLEPAALAGIIVMSVTEGAQLSRDAFAKVADMLDRRAALA